MADHYLAALDRVSDAQAARAHLSDLYKLPADERDARLVASLHSDLGHSLKMAEIHAQLYIGQQLSDLRLGATA